MTEVGPLHRRQGPAGMPLRVRLLGAPGMQLPRHDCACQHVQQERAGDVEKLCRLLTEGLQTLMVMRIAARTCCCRRWRS